MDGRSFCVDCGKWFGVEDDEKETLTNHECKE